MCFCRLRGMLSHWAVWWWGRKDGVEWVNYKLMTFWLIVRGWQVNRWSHSGPLLLMSRRVHYLNALVPWCKALGGPDAAVCRQWTTTVWDPFSLHHLWPKYDSSEILPPTLKTKLLFDLDYQGRQKKIWNYFVNAKETFLPSLSLWTTVLFCRFVKLYAGFFNHRHTWPCDATAQADITGAVQMQSQ